jgi:hypothetical protein
MLSKYSRYMSREECINYNNKLNTINTSTEQIISNKMSNMICKICYDNIQIPVLLTKNIFCEDCGDECAGVCCLSCTRKWLQLNTPNNIRKPIKHLICDKWIDTNNLNAKKSYTVDQTLIKLLDIHNPKEIICECKKKYKSRKDFYYHMGDGTCELSTFKCRFCNFRGRTAEIVRHYTRTDYEGCKIINTIHIY